MDVNILGIDIESKSRDGILESIKKYIKKPIGFFQIVSINPECLVLCQTNADFKQTVNKAQIKLIDGIGVVIASRILDGELIQRYSGVDLVQDLLDIASEQSLRVMLIGAGPKIAEKAAECQRKVNPELEILGIQGILDIKNPKIQEEEKIFSIVSDFKPHFIFVAFGMPYQDLWLYRNQARLTGSVTMGVGGTLDYLSHRLPRAPMLLRIIGLEWLFRLILQPWRIRRQLRLIEFIRLVIKERKDKINLPKNRSIR